jgi:hypothetical protein
MRECPYEVDFYIDINALTLIHMSISIKNFKGANIRLLWICPSILFYNYS